MSENNTSSSATTSAIDLGDEPFAVGHYRTVSNNMTSEGACYNLHLRETHQ